MPIVTGPAIEPHYAIINYGLFPIDKSSHLRSNWAEVRGVAYACPRLYRERWQETTIAPRGSTIGDALEGEDPPLHSTTNLARGRFYYEFVYDLILSIDI